MSNDVLITPASRKIEFKDASANVDAKIETDASGNLLITNTGGDISIGDTTSDIFVGDGTNNIDIVFEQDGEIRGTSGVTVTLGQSDSNIRMATDLNLNNNDITNVGDLTVTGNLTITGDINSYNVTDLDVTDKTITLGVGQTEANSGSSGIIIDGSAASMLWDEGDNRFEFNKNIYAPVIYGSGAGITSLNASNISSGTLASARLPDLAVSDFAGSAIQTGSESFSDSDTILMTAAAVQDKILSYSYSTTDTTYTAGTGLTLSGTQFNVGGLTLSELASGSYQDSSSLASNGFYNTDVKILTSAAVDDLILSKGYTTNVGDVTSVSASSPLSVGGGAGPTPNISFVSAAITTSTSDADGDFFLVHSGTTSSGGLFKLTKANINLSGFNNDSGFLTSSSGLNASNLTSGTVPSARLATGASGDWWSGNVVKVGTDGVSEVGKYIDFHNTDAGTSDFDTRLYSSGSSELTINGSGRIFTDGYHPNADTWTTARTITLGGDLTGNVSINGSANVTLTATVVDDSHNHNHSDGNFTVNGLLQAGAGSNHISTAAAPFRWQRSSSGQTGQDDNVSVYVDDSNIYFTHNNDDDGDASGYLFRYMTGGTATNLLVFSSSTMTYKGQTVFHTGYHPNADTWTTARTITLGGDLSGNVSINGSANVTLTATVADDSHNHIISNVDGLQTALDAKLASSSYTAADVLTKIKTVDGSGSGLDADLFDGTQKSDFDHAEGFKTWTGINAASTQAKRYHIARLYGCPAHWDGNWQNIEFTVTAESYESGYLKFRLMGDYGGAGSQANMIKVFLSEVHGPMVGRFQFVLGSPVDAGWDHSGQDTFYVDLYAEAAHYSQWKINAKTYGHGYQTSNPSSGGATTVFYTSPTTTNTSTFDVSYNDTYIRGSKIWNALNDGSGSGLDADLLDGQHGSYYAPIASPSFTTKITTPQIHHTGVISVLNGSSAQGMKVASLYVGTSYNNSAASGQVNTLNGYRVQGTEVINSSGNWVGGGNISEFTNNSGYITGNQTITLSGDVSGSGTTSIAVTIADDSHTHDGRYFTETEADARFINVTGDTATGIHEVDGRWHFNPSTNSSYREGIRLNRSTTGWGGAVFGGVRDSIDGITEAWWVARNPSKNLVLSYATSADNGGLVLTHNTTTMTYKSQRVFMDDYHPNADKWTTARTLSLTGDVTGSVSWDGSGNASITTVVADDSHNHVISNVDGLQTALDSKLSTSGTAANSQLLDSLDSTAFLRSNADDTMSEKLTFSQYSSGAYMQNPGGVTFSSVSSGDNSLVLRNLGQFRFEDENNWDWNKWGGIKYDSSANTMYIGGPVSSHFTSNSSPPSIDVNFVGLNASGLKKDGNVVWHAGNDGSGSGLDADTLDGIQGASFLRSDTADTYSDIRASGSTNTGRFISSNTWGTTHYTDNGYIQFGPANSSYAHIYTDRGNFYFNVTALYANGNTMWHAGNDGSGSGLDADSLDGYNAEEGAVNNSIVKRDGTASIKAHGISLMRQSTPTTGISWYNEAYYNWQDYMAAAGTTSCGPNGNLTAPTGLAGVTSWALRSRMEGVASYGWNWETGGSGGGGATATSKMSLNATTGNLQIAGAFTAGGDVTAFSDKKLKDNIEVIENAVDKVKQIRGVTFTRNDLENQKRHAGVIAQEVEKVLPEVVEYNKDTDTKTVAYGNMVGLLVEAIKEQQETIDKLTSRINDLEKGE